MAKMDMTVAERGALVTAALPPVALTAKQRRELEDVVYTLREAGIWDLEAADDALRAWGAVEIVMRGQFSKDMRL